MAEILIKAISAVHSESEKDSGESAKRGDPIIVKSDGWPWGIEEKKSPFLGGKFVILKIPGVEPSVVEKYIASTLDANGDIILFRKYKFDVDAAISITGALLVNGNYLTLDSKLVDSYIKKK